MTTTARLLQFLILLVPPPLLLLLEPINGFILPPPSPQSIRQEVLLFRRRTPNSILPKKLSVHGLAPDNTSNNDDSSKVTPQTNGRNKNNDNDKDDLIQTRDCLVERVEDIVSLREELIATNSTTTLAQLETSLDLVEQDVSTLTSQLIPPPGLTLNEYNQAIVGFLRLPLRCRWALCISLNMDDSFQAATQLERVPEVVGQLFAQRSLLTPDRLQMGLKQSLAARITPKEEQEEAAAQRDDEKQEKDGPLLEEVILKKGSKMSSSSSSSQRGITSSSSSSSKKDKTIFANIFGEKETNQNVVERRSDALLARVTRKEGRVATEQDLKILMACLDRDIFAVTEKDKINGGFILQGKVSKKSKGKDDIIKALDERLPARFPAQVCYVQDFTNLEDSNRDPVLLVLNKDMSPTTSGWLLSATSALAVFTAFLFSYDVYGSNDEVMSTLLNPSITTDDMIAVVNWFNGKIAEILLPLAAIQSAHELGHFIIARRDGIKTTFPTLMPCWGLPFLSALTNLKESPRNFQSLFDFALLGPLFGLVTSMALFLAGLILGNLATPDIVKYFPALSVDVIKMSTLGGSVIDYFMGGEGIVTSLDPSASIPLHPFAIAGFMGLLTNSLELLPLGATDGGRLSLALFGRKGQTLVTGFTWLALILTSFLVARADAISGAWIIFSIAQIDAEIPCRDEVTEIDAVRAAIAFGMWFVAALVIVPM